MKKMILLILITFMMAGCVYQNPDGSYDTSKSLMMKTFVIDSCEYIYGYNRLAHKGNCRFCKERRQKEWKELVEQLKKQIIYVYIFDQFHCRHYSNTMGLR